MLSQSNLRKLMIGIALSAVLASLSGCGSSDHDSRATGVQGVMSGSIDQVIDSVGVFLWGDSLNMLCQQWSIFQFEESGWFYGTSYPWSSTDVYVLQGPADPLAVLAAENFDFTDQSVTAQEGDTVFFRGRNGFFGAWTIDSIDGGMGAALSGTWYFKAGGGGDFTSALVSGGVSEFDVLEGVCDQY